MIFITHKNIIKTKNMFLFNFKELFNFKQKKETCSLENKSKTNSKSSFYYMSKHHGCRDGKTCTGRNRSRNTSSMKNVDKNLLVNSLKKWLIAEKGGNIESRELAEFYKSSYFDGLDVPKGGALKLLKQVENSGLKFTHFQNTNQLTIEVDKKFLSTLQKQELLELFEMQQNSFIELKNKLKELKKKIKELEPKKKKVPFRTQIDYDK